jgi:hypothetical protein
MSAPPGHQTVRLGRGSHRGPEEGACVMELASMLAGESFTDHPRSVCPVVASYLRALNDLVDDDARQLLYPYASRAVGTVADAAVRQRRVERCREALESLRSSRRGALRRLVEGARRRPGDGSPISLEHFTLSVVRVLRRSGPGWQRRALALADELIAASEPPAAGGLRDVRADVPAAAA